MLPAGRRPGGRHHPRARAENCTAATAGHRLGRSRRTLLDAGGDRQDRGSAGPRASSSAGCASPTDGIAKAVRAVAAQLDRATARGARLLDAPRGARRPDAGGRVTGVVPTRARSPADIVVCCAGIWGPKIAAHGRPDPPAHPAGPPVRLDRSGAAAGRPHRGGDAARSCGTRTPTSTTARTATGLGIGYYGHRPMPIKATDLAPGPRPRPAESAVGAGLHPGRLRIPPGRDRSAAALARRRGDGEGLQRPLLVHHRQHAAARAARHVDGFWVAEAVWVTHSAGVGRAMAEWLVDGHCSSLRPARVRRQPVRARTSSRRTTSSPGTARTSSRSTTSCTRCSRWSIRGRCGPRPFYPRQQELGGVFLEANGWERPQWYAANARLLPASGTPAGTSRSPDDWAAQYWSPIVAAEAQVTRDRRGDVRHDGAEAARGDRAGRHRIPAEPGHRQGGDKSVGSVTYCLLLDVDGGIRQRRHRRPAGARAVPGRRQRQPRPGLAAPPPARRATADGRTSATSPRAPAASGSGARGPATWSSR